MRDNVSVLKFPVAVLKSEATKILALSNLHVEKRTGYSERR